MTKQQNETSTTTEMNHIEAIIGRILQIGVSIAAIIMALGLLLLIIKGGQTGYAKNVHPTTISGILRGITQLKPYAVMMLGLFCLILTPILRVVVSIYAFAKEHDRLYVVITTLVLVILGISFVIGHTV